MFPVSASVSAIQALEINPLRSQRVIVLAPHPEEPREQH